MSAFRAVSWSFFGVCRGRDLEGDARRLGPVIGLAGAAPLVGVLPAWFASRP